MSNIVHERLHSSLQTNNPQRPSIRGKLNKSYSFSKKLEVFEYYYDNNYNKSLVERILWVPHAYSNCSNYKRVFVQPKISVIEGYLLHAMNERNAKIWLMP